MSDLFRVSFLAALIATGIPPTAASADDGQAASKAATTEGSTVPGTVGPEQTGKGSWRLVPA